ncbi:MAG: isoprenylcysteine carboxylmethyltransferase family protein [Actinomycetota bacterium]
MSLDEQRLAVLIIVSLTVLVRLVAHRVAGGIARDQSDGMEQEGGVVVAVAARLVFLVGGLGSIVVWLVADDIVPGQLELPGWVPWVGLVIAELGFALLMWVHIALGVHFSGTLHIRDDHSLIQDGPYTIVRHPMYTSFLMIFAGLALLTGNVVVALAFFGSQAWVLGVRLGAEEAQLAERFGDQWASYSNRTGALTPRLWRRRGAAS